MVLLKLKQQVNTALAKHHQNYHCHSLRSNTDFTMH